MIHKELLPQNTIDEIRYKMSIDKKGRINTLLSYEPNIQAILFIGLSKFLQKEILNQLKDEEIVNLSQSLDPDEITDILELLPKDRKKLIILKLEDDLRESVSFLSNFLHDSAGGLMNLDYVEVEENETFKEAILKFKKHENRTGRLPIIIITKNKIVQGFLPAHELGLNNENEIIKPFTHKIKTINYNAKKEEILNIFNQHPHIKVAVLGENQNVIGIIYSGDVLKLLKNRESDSLYSFAGVNKEESVRDSFLKKIKFRYKWLILNLFTGFLVVITLSFFEDILSEFVILAIYMPIIAGMGGNAGTQTLAVLIRGIALNEIKLKDSLPVLKNELMSGFVNGIINGLIIASVVILVHGNYKLAFVLGIALLINLLVAVISGTLVPLFMKKIGKDPAVSSTIFITTFTDVLGFIAFLGLAVLIL